MTWWVPSSRTTRPGHSEWGDWKNFVSVRQGMVCHLKMPSQDWEEPLCLQATNPTPFAQKYQSLLDKLRSLVATYHYRRRISELASEMDPITGDYFNEREDHCHILKRIWKHTGEKGPDGTNLQGFDDAVLDPSTGLTFISLHFLLVSFLLQRVQQVYGNRPAIFLLDVK